MDRRSFIKISSTSLMTAAVSPALASNQNLQDPDLISNSFTLKVDGKPVIVYRAAGNYSFANFEFNQPAHIEITANNPDFWKQGIEVQPWRHGIRPTRTGNTINFVLDSAEKLSITQPENYFAGAEILFLSANETEGTIPSIQDKNVRFFGPGIYREDIHVKNNQTIYLAEGAIVLGSLNFWSVKNATVCGRGIILHDGSQNPNDDEGWQHRPNWHGITVHDSQNIVVSGITVLVRSRTWMIQLQGSKDITFNNIKVIGGTKGNANQDGIDWLGCGDTLVSNCFFRCSDDIFAIYGNTGFYDDNVAILGKDVRNIVIEKCLLSTSISNVMRIGWMRKVFNSSNVIMRDCDVLHMGMGSCFVPFALAEFWADPGGKGIHENYLFENIRLESWYSLAQLRQPLTKDASLRNIHFRNIWALKQPPLVPSHLSGNITGINFENIIYGDSRIASPTDLQIQQTSVETPAINQHANLQAEFTYDTGMIHEGKKITFNAESSHSAGKTLQYYWNFGDGQTARGKIVSHIFSDTMGTLLDDSGIFRVQLKIVDDRGNTDSIIRPVFVTRNLLAATLPLEQKQAIQYKLFSKIALSWKEIQARKADKEFINTQFLPSGLLPKSGNYCLLIEGLLKVPDDGGYIFQAMARDGIHVFIDDQLVLHNDKIEAQVCNTLGNRVQATSAGIGLKAGSHKIRIAFRQGEGELATAIYWQDPNIKLSPINSYVS